MKAPAFPANEEQRQAELEAAGLLDSPAEPALDALIAAVASRLRVPMALISLIDRERQWFKSRHGLDASETPREISFCGHAVAEGKPLVVGDALADPRFADNPLVAGAPHIRAYAGMPLTTSKGHTLGTLCVIDQTPREFAVEDLAFLSAVAQMLTENFELRAQARQQEQALRVFAEELGDAVAYLDAQGRIVWASREARALLRLPPPEEAAPHELALASCFKQPEALITALLPALTAGQSVLGFEAALAGPAETETLLRLDLGPPEGDPRQPLARCRMVRVSDLATMHDRLRRYEQLFQFSQDLFCTVDGRGYFDLLNPSWERVLGFSLEALRAQPIGAFIHPDDVDRSMQGLQRVLESQGTLSFFENRYLTRDGGYRLLSWRGMVVDGYFVGTARDVTEESEARTRLGFSLALQSQISSLQQRLIGDGDDAAGWWRSTLEALITHTGSEYGFIGSIEEDDQGRFLRTHAITDISWDDASRRLYEESQTKGMVFRNLNTLFGEVIRKGETLVSNDVRLDLRAGGRPPGHPPLRTFLGLACGDGPGMVAMVGLGNRPGGYAESLVQDLRPAAVFIESAVRQTRLAARRRAAEQRLQAVVETTPDAIITINAEGIVLAANAAVQQIFGHAPKDCVGRNISMLMAAPERDAHDGYLRRFRETGEAHIIGTAREMRAMRRDGQLIWVELTVTPVTLSGEPCFTGILRDITQRVESERLLRSTASQLGLALEMARAGHWEYAVDADRFTFSDAFLKIFGASSAALGGHVMSSSDYADRFIHPEDAALMREALADICASADPDISRQFEHRIVYADGRTGHLLVRIFGERNAAGHIIRLFGVAQDVSERLQQEQARARFDEQERMNQTLAQRIEELDRNQTISALTSECVELLQRCVSHEEALEVSSRFLERMYPLSNVCIYAALTPEEGMTLHASAQRFGERAPPKTLDEHDCWGLRMRRAHITQRGGNGIPCRHCPPDSPNVTLCAPLVSMERVVALVSVTLAASSAESRGDERRVERVAAQFQTTLQSLSGAMSTIALRETLQRLALVDELTGLPNRRAFTSSAQRAVATARRAGEDLAVAMVDVDHFKKINDSHGHDEGDRVLRELARTMLDFFREGDLLGRLGGEEFGVVLSGITEDFARRRLDAFREEVARRCTVRQTPVTVSVGFTRVKRAGGGLDELLKAADRALYLAKDQGRNRVVSAEELAAGDAA